MVNLTSKVMAILRLVIISIGLLGNVISFIVFSRPVFRKNSISTYCRALAIFDFFTIADLIISIGLGFFDTFYPFYSDTACKVYFYIIFGFASIPGWILIAFSLDKVLTMKRIWTNTLKKKSFQYGVVVEIVLINLLLYIEIPIYLKLVTFNIYGTKIDVCDTSTLPFGIIIATMFLIGGSILPFFIMLTSTIVSIKMIRDSARNIERTSNTNSSNRNSRDFKFAISSVAFNISFIVFKMPFSLIFFLENFIPSLTTFYELIATTGTISYFHYSTSFFIHLCTNSIFRRELMIIFKVYIMRSNATVQPSNTVALSNIKSNIVSVTNKITEND